MASRKNGTVTGSNLNYNTISYKDWYQQYEPETAQVAVYKDGIWILYETKRGTEYNEHDPFATMTSILCGKEKSIPVQFPTNYSYKNKCVVYNNFARKIIDGVSWKEGGDVVVLTTALHNIFFGMLSNPDLVEAQFREHVTIINMLIKTIQEIPEDKLEFFKLTHVKAGIPDDVLETALAIASTGMFTPQIGLKLLIIGLQRCYIRFKSVDFNIKDHVGNAYGLYAVVAAKYIANGENVLDAIGMMDRASGLARTNYVPDDEGSIDDSVSVATTTVYNEDTRKFVYVILSAMFGQADGRALLPYVMDAMFRPTSKAQIDGVILVTQTITLSGGMKIYPNHLTPGLDTTGTFSVDDSGIKICPRNAKDFSIMNVDLTKAPFNMTVRVSALTGSQGRGWRFLFRSGKKNDGIMAWKGKMGPTISAKGGGEGNGLTAPTMIVNKAMSDNFNVSIGVTKNGPGYKIRIVTSEWNSTQCIEMNSTDHSLNIYFKSLEFQNVVLDIPEMPPSYEASTASYDGAGPSGVNSGPVAPVAPSVPQSIGEKLVSSLFG
jgi:hypothetical protein